MNTGDVLAMKPHRVGCVHGRFQPFHNAHLQYALAALKLCQHVIIGLTQPDIRRLQSSAEATHREISENNPFTYFERVSMISGALIDAGIERETFSFSPFPIESPETIADFVGPDAVHITTIVESWNREKVRRLRSAGFLVEIVWENESKYPSGSEIRRMVRSGDAAWRNLVPAACHTVIEEVMLKHLGNVGQN